MGRPRVYDEERVATAMRLPATLHQELQSAAEERDVSVNLLVIRAIRQYLEALLPIDRLTEERRSEERRVS
jgi:predicted transcriptional regulator